MNSDFCVFAFVLGCLVFGAGWVTRGWSDAQAPPKIERRPIVVRPANILTCPVTKLTIEEYERDCRARERSHATKPRGTI